MIINIISKSDRLNFKNRKQLNSFKFSQENLKPQYFVVYMYISMITDPINVAFKNFKWCNELVILYSQDFIITSTVTS